MLHNILRVQYVLVSAILNHYSSLDKCVPTSNHSLSRSLPASIFSAERNQAQCSQLFPAALSLLHSLPGSQQDAALLCPAVTFMASCVANNGQLHASMQGLFNYVMIKGTVIRNNAFQVVKRSPLWL